MAQETIRLAEPADLSKVTGLYRDMLDEEAPPREALEKSWNQIMGSDGTLLFLLEIDGRPASTCMLAIIPNLTRGARPFGVIENVVTAGDLRGRGYGGRIVRHAVETAWQRGCYKVMLLTGRKDEKVYRLYEGAGLRRDIKQAFAAYAEDMSK
jgi:GNAT superfamily N-acetyltransferase